MPDVVKFVRQLSHDLRNHLNAAELQSAYIAELAEDPELKEEIKRLRGMISEVGVTLQTRHLSAQSAQRLTLMPYGAADFVEDLRQKLATDFRTKARRSNGMCKRATPPCEIDPQLLQPALLELFANAFRHDRAEGVISVDGADRKAIVSSSPSANRNGTSNLRPKTGDASRCDRWARVIMALAFIGRALSSRLTAAN